MLVLGCLWNNKLFMVHFNTDCDITVSLTGWLTTTALKIKVANG